MSSQNKHRIKGLHIKNNSNSYSELTPFGTDGELIDMFSNLDLEQELKLGGDHYIELQDNDDEIIIKEWYYTEYKGNRTRAEMTNYCTYSVITSFIDNATATAIDIGEENVLIDHQEQNNNLIVIADDEAQNIIEISLYKGDLEEENSVLLHTKKITINPPINGIETAQEDKDFIEEIEGEGD